MPAHLVDGIYFYHPSQAAAIVFQVLFSILSGSHLFQSVIVPYRRAIKHRYTIPLFIAAALSTAGYGVRIGSIQTPSDIGQYATSASLIVVAPIFVCATLYLQLAYMLRHCIHDVKEQKVFGITPCWLGRIFISSDISSFLLQGAGSGIAASNNWTGNTKSIGVNLLLTGLAGQLATFTVFLVLLWRFGSLLRSSSNTTYGKAEKRIVQSIWIAGIFVQVRQTPPDFAQAK